MSGLSFLAAAERDINQTSGKRSRTRGKSVSSLDLELAPERHQIGSRSPLTSGAEYGRVPSRKAQGQHFESANKSATKKE